MSTTKVAVPKGLRREGAALYRSIAGDLDPGLEFDAVELDTLRRACELADLAADLKADVAQRGLYVIGSRNQEVANPSVGRLAQVQRSITAMTARLKLSPPPVRTGRLNARQRAIVRDLDAGRR